MRQERDFRSGSDSYSDESAAEAPPEALSSASEQMLIKVESALPALAPSARTELALRRAQQAAWDLITEPYCSAVERIQRLEREERESVRSHDRAEAGLAASNLPAVLRRAERREIAERSRDALEEARREKGLDQLRRELLKELARECRPERALRQLDHIAHAALGLSCRTIAEANQLFPHLTLAELSLLSLLQHFPRTFLECGNRLGDAGQRAVCAAFSEYAEGEWAGLRRRVPQYFFASVDGISFIADDFEISAYDIDDSWECDPYAVLGMNNHRIGMETVPFRPEIGNIVRTLVPLMISNGRLFRRLWQECDNAVQLGTGRVAELALERIGAPPREDGRRDCASALDALDGARRAALAVERASLERRMAAAALYEGSKKFSRLRAQDVFRLVGLLERVPACLIGERPFVGYFQAYGAAVRFFSTQGVLLEECALSPLHRRETILSMQAERADGSKENQTVARLFRRLAARVHEGILKRYLKKGGELSGLETTAVDVWLASGVRLEILGMPRADAGRGGWAAGGRLNGKRSHTEFFQKIGAEEARQFRTTLGLLPRPMLEQAGTVLKQENSHLSLDTLMSGMLRQGEYDRRRKLITIFESRDWRYPDLSGKAKAQRSFVLVHETAEALWTTLDPAEKARWEAISWPRARGRRLAKHFLTQYSHAVDARDDFCEHLAAFVLHGEEFRERAEAAGPLRLKYAFIRRLVAARCGGPLEFPRLMDWTIEDLHGSVLAEMRHKYALEEALLEQQRQDEERYDHNREALFEVRQSFEDHAAQWEREEEAGEIDDPEERAAFLAEPDGGESIDCLEIKTEEGPILFQAVRVELLEILRAHLTDEDDEKLRPLRDALLPLVMAQEWEDVWGVLRRSVVEEAGAILRGLREIDPSPQRRP